MKEPREPLKRALRPLGLMAALAVVLTSLAFVERTANRTPVAQLSVRVSGEPGTHFIDEEAVRRELMAFRHDLIGTALGDLDLPGLEAHLRALPAVASAEAYHTLDGTLHVKVMQREAILRLMAPDGSGFYLDREGHIIPLSPVHTARVPVALLPGGPGLTPDSAGTIGLIGRLHQLAAFVHGDPLWRALIDQVRVTPAGEFELIPCVGGHRILIGDGTALEERFAKLRLFYRHAIPVAGWRGHERIDLRFAGQVVLTERTTP